MQKILVLLLICCLFVQGRTKDKVIVEIDTEKMIKKGFAGFEKLDSANTMKLLMEYDTITGWWMRTKFYMPEYRRPDTSSQAKQVFLKNYLETHSFYKYPIEINHKTLNCILVKSTLDYDDAKLEDPNPYFGMRLYSFSDATATLLAEHFETWVNVRTNYRTNLVIYSNGKVVSTSYRDFRSHMMSPTTPTYKDTIITTMQLIKTLKIKTLKTEKFLDEYARKLSREDAERTWQQNQLKRDSGANSVTLPKSF